MKRALDLAASASGLFVFGPVLGAIALAIRKESAGPIFYRGIRIGQHGKPFRIFKFRTMVVDAEGLGASSTADDDPRITRVGRLLRKYKLDELPQLFNVLSGEMSLVGPRPEVQQFVEMYTEEEKAILEVKPGITDWASIWNPDEGAILAGSEDPDKAYLEEIRPNKIRLQLEYVRQRSVLTDLKILAETAKVLLTGQRPAVDERNAKKGTNGEAR